jgi:ketosteroid isomerase-like protein
MPQLKCKRTALCICLLLNIAISHSDAQTPSTNSSTKSDSIAVQKTLEHFISAFTNLDWPAFTACFTPDATAFFPPSAQFPGRANNLTEIKKVFQKVFDHFHTLSSTPPYFAIDPIDTHIQMLGDCAIATFTLHDPGMLGRRTLVLQKKGETWLIVHLHASGILTTQ